LSLDNWIHLKITKPSNERYEFPDSVLPGSTADASTDPTTTSIRFNCTASPFTRSEVQTSVASQPLIFESQYMHVKTDLPANANLYEIGEPHTDTFRLPMHNFTRTMQSRDAQGVPQENKLYGNNRIHVEHRATSTHGFFIANSNG
ncbi:uncharacterized protein BXZ73DRAFT_26205, partial [Epithele typhae]|uniref:uncharacterized protein n=1 Tax=Epithele typhae TaxID=378194 RepID=UPI002008C85B